MTTPWQVDTGATAIRRVQRQLRWVVGVLCLLLLSTSWAADTTVIDIPPEFESIDLAPVAYVLEDKEGVLSLDAIQGRHAGEFQHSSAKTGISASAYWWRFRLHNTSDNSQTLWFDTDSKKLREVDFYLLDPAKGLQDIAHQSSGAMQTFDERPLPTASFVFPFTLGANQTVDVVLRVRSYGLYPGSIAPRLWRPQAYQQHAKANAIVWFAYLSLAAGFIVFNLFLYFFTRDANFVRYVLAQLGIALWVSVATAGIFGGLFEYAWPNSPLLEQASWPMSIALAFFFMQVFIVHFLDTKRTVPRLHVLLWGIVWIGVLGGAVRTWAVVTQQFALGALLQASYTGLSALGIIWVGLMFIATLQLARTGLRTAKALMIAWTPLFLGLAVTQVLYLQKTPTPVFLVAGSALELVLMSLALADRFNQESRGRERLSRLRRFFSPAVADKLLSENADDFLKPRRREIVVVFVDLRGYTAFTDTHSADDVMQMLGEFHEAMGEIIMAHGGTLERFAGDGLMIFFNDPIEIADPAQQAIAMAVAMQKRFAELQTLWQSRGYTLAMGIGIAQGVATLGAIGFEGRRDYGAIGGVTNLAARLCGEAKGGQILVSASVAEKVSTAVPLLPVGALPLKGFVQPQDAWTVTSPLSPTR